MITTNDLQFLHSVLSTLPDRKDSTIEADEDDMRIMSDILDRLRVMIDPKVNMEAAKLMYKTLAPNLMEQKPILDEVMRQTLAYGVDLHTVRTVVDLEKSLLELIGGKGALAKILSEER